MDQIHVCFVCDGGMGSSALGASLIKKYITNQCIKVSNCAISDLNDNYDVLIIHKLLNHLIKDHHKYKKIYTVEHFFDDKKLIKIVKEINQMISRLNILSKDSIMIGCEAKSSDEAIIKMGNLLLEKNYIEPPYIDGMLKRDHTITTYIGNDIAIPHGEYEVKQYVKNTGIAVMIYPKGISWGDGNVRIVIGIAAKDDDHMEILSNIAIKLSDMDVVNNIVDNQDVEYIYHVLTSEVD